MQSKLMDARLVREALLVAFSFRPSLKSIRVLDSSRDGDYVSFLVSSPPSRPDLFPRHYILRDGVLELFDADGGSISIYDGVPILLV
jgi:hypothetical protein